MSLSYVLLSLLFVVVLTWLKSILSWRLRRKGLPYPPGPKGKPVIGNALDIPVSHQWLKAAEWRKQYGDVIYLEALGNRLVFLNSYDAAVELMEKRSSIHSSRPELMMLNKLQDWEWTFSIMPYGDQWRKHASVFRKFMDPGVVNQYHEMQTQQAVKFLGKLLEAPQDFYNDIRTAIGATIMMISYGHEVAEKNDPYIALAESAMAMITKIVMPGAFLVDIIPWLRYIPAWVPGADFQKVAAEGHKLSVDLRSRPFDEAKSRMNDGSARSSITTQLLERYSNDSKEPLHEEFIKRIAGIVYIAGADTSVSVLQTFFIAMMQNPEVQRRAQEEIDRVVGSDSLPSFNDWQNLRYLDAILKECIRWRPVAPLGSPHMSTEDDVYNGYFIPKGSMIIANQWLMSHDPDVYYEPESFIPERYMREGGRTPCRDPISIVFGFGRRRCPGRHFALNSIYIMMASILSCFNIAKPIGPDGAPVDQDIEYVSGLVLHPPPFRCTVTPRSLKKADIIKQAVVFHATS